MQLLLTIVQIIVNNYAIVCHSKTLTRLAFRAMFQHVNGIRHMLKRGLIFLLQGHLAAGKEKLRGGDFKLSASHSFSTFVSS